MARRARRPLRGGGVGLRGGRNRFDDGAARSDLLVAELEERLAREFDLGAVPPLGGARRDPVIIDSRLAERESVVLEAGSHQESVRIATGDLLRLTNADVADICAG
jgi:prolyl-tRNA editing enzyme YbaK/EbsC (Cys-tRNA(Pro) deacylase)